MEFPGVHDTLRPARLIFTLPIIAALLSLGWIQEQQDSTPPSAEDAPTTSTLSEESTAETSGAAPSEAAPPDAGPSDADSSDAGSSNAGSSDGDARPVYIIPVDGEVENGLYLVLNRAVRQAEKHNAAAIIFDMNTLGGRVDSAIKIRDRIIGTSIPTYTYVNTRAISAGAFIAISTGSIVMAPGSQIGAALPITMGAEGATAADRKFISYFTSEMRSTAKHRGYPDDVVRIVEAFCDPDIAIEGIIEKDDILTLDYEAAAEVGLAMYISDSLEAMLEREGLASAPIERFKYTATDRVARFLSNPVVMGLLMMVGWGGLFFEVRSPGVGFPGAIGVAALILYFFGSYLANLSGYMELIFFILGLALLLVELFVIPGFGIFGILGIVSMAGALFFALFNLAPAGFDFPVTRLYTPSLTMVGALIAVVPMSFMIAKILPHTALYTSLQLEPPKPAGDPAEGSVNAAEVPALPGRGESGTAVTDLRPAGVGTFAGQRFQVLTQGEFIDKGDRIEVVRTEANRLFVRAPRGE